MVKSWLKDERKINKCIYVTKKYFYNKKKLNY